MTRWLAQCNWQVLNFAYSSTTRSAEENVEALQAFVRYHATGELHFVGHSLGGMLILKLFETYPEQPPGRIVLLGSPLQGSRSAKRLAQFWWGRHMMGRATELLVKGLTRLPAEREVGMIAGTSTFGLGRLITHLPSPNDGTVAVDETMLPGLDRRIDLPVSHMSMICSQRVVRCTATFLSTGTFAGC